MRQSTMTRPTMTHPTMTRPTMAHPTMTRPTMTHPTMRPSTMRQPTPRQPRRAPGLLRRLALAACLAAAAALPAHAQETLANADIIQLTRAGVEPSVIVSTIESSRTRFAVGVNDIVTLSNARVNAQVIAAMHASISRSGQARAGMGPGATATAGLPTEFGMYVVEEGESSRLPLVAMTVDDSWTDGRGRSTRRVNIRDGEAVQRKEVASEEPAFILFHPGSQAPRVRMYHLDHIVLDNASLDAEIPLHAGPAGSDPRMVKVTPGIPLDRGSYVFVLGDDFTRVYGFGRVRGTRNIPPLKPAEAVALARRGVAVQTALSPDSARALVLGVLARERIPVEQDFDADGLLVTLRGVRGVGFFSTAVAVQFAVVVLPRGAGSEIRVGADTYLPGNVERWLTREDLADIPLVPAPEQSRRQAELISRDIQRALRRGR